MKMTCDICGARVDNAAKHAQWHGIIRELFTLLNAKK